jgi:hypothetical protein
MEKFTDCAEKFVAGDKASIENTKSEPLSIGLVSDSGCEFEIELLPGQALTFNAGSTNARVILHHGDPAALLIIKPETAI